MSLPTMRRDGCPLRKTCDDGDEDEDEDEDGDEDEGEKQCKKVPAP